MPHHAKSQFLSHRALLHLVIVQAFPYERGENLSNDIIAMIINTHATCSRMRGRRVDVAKSNTALLSRIAKYRAGK